MDNTQTILDFGAVYARDFACKEDYWQAIINLIETINPDYLVIEDFLLYANRAESMINSRFETVKLIGVLEMYFKDKIKIHLQPANQVKKRWNDDLLEHKGIITRSGKLCKIYNKVTSDHIRDALRHCLHFVNFKLKEEMKV